MKYRLLIVMLLLICITAALTYWYTSHELRTLTAAVIADIDATREELIVVAETTGNAQIDDVTNGVLRDCSTRTEYENLLGQLDSLNTADLLRVRDLHGDCGTYLPTVRTFMAYRLEAALAEYEALLATLDTVSLNPRDAYQVEGWRALVEKEKSRAQLLRQQNALQGQIIDVLVSGETSQLADLLQEAQQVNGTLRVTSLQINDDRAALIGS